jgi:hypothetical protein
MRNDKMPSNTNYGLRRLLIACAVVLLVIAMLAVGTYVSTSRPGGSGTAMSNDNVADESRTRIPHLAISSPTPGELEANYNDDSRLILGCNSIGGSIVVFVNKSPVAIHKRGCLLIPIGDLLINGRNEIVIEGGHTNPLFAKVLLMDTKQQPFVIHNTVAKKMLPQKSSREVISFDYKRDSQTKYQELDSNRDRDSIEALAKDLVALYQQHKGEEFYRRIYSTDNTDYTSWKDVCEENKRGIDKINDRRYTVVTRDTEIKYIFGRYTVYMYTDYCPELGMHYLIKTEKDDGREFYYDHLCFAKYKGHWVAK